MEENPVLLAMVRAVCDGASVDWDAASAGASDSFRRAVAELRIVADVANLHRSLEGATDVRPLPIQPQARTPTARVFARWGHLELVEHVASGSFGDVYRAWDPAIEREVALKLLRPRASQADEQDARIEEGRLLARVRHPNVVTVYGAARIDGRVGIWMEFVRGRTLAQLVAQDGPVRLVDAARVGAALSDAVAAVHESGLLHRDIKAQNVMLADDGRVVLMDFGTGRALDERPRDVAGTPLYLAPEVIAGREASIQSDVYSLGVLIHLLVTGTFPSPAPWTPVDPARRQAVAGEPKAARVPSRLEPILARALAHHPGERFHGVGQMRDALTALHAPARVHGSRRSLVVASMLTFAVSGAALALLDRGLSPATPSATDSAPLAGGEALRKLPWRVMPTGAPARSGRFIGAVDWDATGAGLAVVVDLASNQARRLWDPAPGEPELGVYSLSSSFASDGSQLALAWYVGGPDERTELRTSRPDGTGLRTVYRYPRGEFRVLGWSPASDQVLLLRMPAVGANDLAWVTLRDGHARVVIQLPDRPYASLHPNGRDLLMDWPQPGAPGKRDLVLADMVSGVVRPFLAEPANDAMPVWLADGRRVLFGSDRGGTFGAWLTEVGPGPVEPQQVRASLGHWEPVGFGSRGEFLYIAQTGTVDVYTVSLDVNRRIVGPRQKIATSFQGRNLFGDWAPDSRHLAFTSRRGPINFAASSQAVVVRDVTSTDERVIPTPFGDIGRLRWAPDGRRIALPVSKPTSGAWVLDVPSGRLQRVVSTPDRIWDLAWLSDEKLLYLTSGPGPGGLRTASLTTRKDVELGRDIAEVALSQARDRIALKRRTRGGLTVSVAAADTLAGETEVFRTGPPFPLQLAGWTPDDRYIVAVRPAAATGDARDGLVEVLAIPADGGSPLPVGIAPLGRDARTVRLSPDGTRLSFESGSPALTTWVLEHPLLAR